MNPSNNKSSCIAAKALNNIARQRQPGSNFEVHAVSVGNIDCSLSMLMSTCSPAKSSVLLLFASSSSQLCPLTVHYSPSTVRATEMSDYNMRPYRDDPMGKAISDNMT